MNLNKEKLILKTSPTHYIIVENIDPEANVGSIQLCLNNPDDTDDSDDSIDFEAYKDAIEISSEDSLNDYTTQNPIEFSQRLLNAQDNSNCNTAIKIDNVIYNKQQICKTLKNIICGIEEIIKDIEDNFLQDFSTDVQALQQKSKSPPNPPNSMEVQQPNEFMIPNKNQVYTKQYEIQTSPEDNSIKLEVFLNMNIGNDPKSNITLSAQATTQEYNSNEISDVIMKNEITENTVENNTNDDNNQEMTIDNEQIPLTDARSSVLKAMNKSLIPIDENKEESTNPDEYQTIEEKLTESNEIWQIFTDISNLVEMTEMKKSDYSENNIEQICSLSKTLKETNKNRMNTHFSPNLMKCDLNKNDKKISKRTMDTSEFIADVWKDLQVLEQKIARAKLLSEQSSRITCIGNESFACARCRSSLDREISYPATIISVRPVGNKALYVAWIIHSFQGLTGYEISVDGCLKNRLLSSGHDCACVYNVNVHETHLIVLHPISDNNNDQEKGNSSFLCKTSELGQMNEIPREWSPSSFIYKPDCPRNNNCPFCCV